MTEVTNEVARVLREHFDPTGTERQDPYAMATYEEAAQALAEAGLLRDCAVNVHESCNRELGNALGDVEAFRDDLTALRDGLMERIGRYTPSDADLLAYVDALKAQIGAQEPAGATQGGSGDSRASGGLGERLRAEAEAGRVGQHARLSAIADEADRLEVGQNGARIKVQLDRVVALADEWASSPAVGSSSAEQWEFDTLRNAARDLRDVLAEEVP